MINTNILPPTLIASKVPEDAAVQADDRDEPEEIDYYEPAIDGEVGNSVKEEKNVRNLYKLIFFY